MADRDDRGERDARVFAPATLTTAPGHPVRWLLVVLLIGGLVIAKPWGASTGASPTVHAASSAAPTALPSAVAVASVAPSADPDDIDGPIVRTCLRPGIWLVATEEDYEASSVRIWRAVDPIAQASGPSDPRIPVVPVSSEGVVALGWCAPTHGAGRPAVPATIQTWRIVRGVTQAISLAPILPVGDPSPFGALYGPPDVGDAVWPDGRLVVRHHDGDGLDRWFAMDVENRPIISAPPSQSPRPGSGQPAPSTAP